MLFVHFLHFLHLSNSPFTGGRISSWGHAFVHFLHFLHLSNSPFTGVAGCPAEAGLDVERSQGDSGSEQSTP
jgi:hypothetical protein